MSIQKLHYENLGGTLVRREGLLSWRCPLCKAEGQSLEVMRTCPECGSKEAALPGAQNAPVEQDASVRKAWARFSHELHRSPDAPYPGMADAFEQHFSQSFIDREWKAEAATWAAAWKAAKNHGAQPAPRMNMQTADQITQAFKAELQALLDKYGAELSARDTWEGYPECGEDVRMHVDVPAIYDADHNCLREYTEIDLGSWVSSTQAMPKEIKP